MLMNDRQAFNSTKTLSAAVHPYRPIHCDQWGIFSLRSSFHYPHIDAAGLATGTSIAHGHKLWCTGRKINRTAYSMNHQHGHSIDSAAEEVIWESTVIGPGDTMYVLAAALLYYHN